MILKNCNIHMFHQRVEADSLICYGIGHDLQELLKNYDEYPWKDKIRFLVDNSRVKQGQKAEVQGKRFEISSMNNILAHIQKNTVILITCSYYYEIIHQLNEIKELQNSTCYIYNFMINLSLGDALQIGKKKEFKIPAVIHYCWFGGKPLPDLYKRCMESWQNFCPEYQIKEWNEDNCDLNENLYARQAYEYGKYGFVPDYFRLKIIYEHGGIYLDTDVEIIKNLDLLRYETAFCGLQLPGQAALGLGFGAAQGHPCIKKMLDTYQKLSFLLEDGRLNETISSVYQTDDLMEMGMRYGNRRQKVRGMTIYPTEVLSPKNLYTNLAEITGNTFAIHHFDGSWVSGERLLQKEKRWREAREIQEMFEE